jgi:hypothetical protein
MVLQTIDLIGIGMCQWPRVVGGSLHVLTLRQGVGFSEKNTLRALGRL